MKFEKLEKIIKSNKTFLLTTHVNPDADAIGSEMAFYYLLKKLDKTVYVINHSETPENLFFLDEEKVINKIEKKGYNELFKNVDVLIALDFNRANRTVSLKEYFNQSNSIKVCIDHHQDSEDFVNHKFIDINYCATGHIVFDFIKKTNIIKIDEVIATNLYAAIMTDTGSFKFSRTTSEVHNIAAELLCTGVSPIDVHDKIYGQGKFGKVKLLGLALKSIKLFGDEKRICYAILKQKDFKECGVKESDTDGFVNFTLSIENVDIGMLFIELQEGFKVSFRSKDDIDVNALAQQFGGGGHKNAAGTRVFGKQLDEVIPDILNSAKEIL